MAAGGFDRCLDNRVSCSICLEPYRGRHPKLLPCLHTFCLPCLTQLADMEDSQSVSSAEVTGVSSAGGGDSPVTIACPTCRTPISLPPAGVSALHNNPYIDGCGDQESGSLPLLCDLCEEGQEAKLTCFSCESYFCTRCRRTHDKLCKSSQVTEVKVVPEVDGSRQDNGAIKLLMQKQSDLEKVVSSLQSLAATLQASMTTLQKQNSFMCRNLSGLQDNNTKVEKELSTSKKEQEALQRELVSLKDKNAILCQDNQQLRYEVTKLHDVVTKAQNDVSKIQDNSTALQQLQDTMQGQVAKLRSNTDTSQLQADVASLKTDQGKLQNEITSLRISNLQSEVVSLKTDQCKLQLETVSLKTDQGKLQHEMINLKTDNGRLNGDMGNLSFVQSQIRQDVNALSIKVFFQAMLVSDVTLKKNDTLVCDGILASVGGGYDCRTGVFTAPVSGVYCFMATSSPLSNDKNIWGNAHIVRDNTQIAYFLAHGTGSSTAHVLASVRAGQRVWLRCYEDKSQFHGGWLTTFTGSLVHPAL